MREEIRQQKLLKSAILNVANSGGSMCDVVNALMQDQWAKSEYEKPRAYNGNPLEFRIGNMAGKMSKNGEISYNKITKVFSTNSEQPQNIRDESKSRKDFPKFPYILGNTCTCCNRALNPIILEEAHLDKARHNGNLYNRAILCRNCHTLHDFGSDEDRQYIRKSIASNILKMKNHINEHFSHVINLIQEVEPDFLLENI